MILRTTSISKQYGGLRALSGLDLSVASGEFVALIGPNGAGKSTLLNVLTGLVSPTDGEIWFDGRNVTRIATHARVRLGLGRTFQHGRLFDRLSVVENVMTGAATGNRRSESALHDAAIAILDRMGLATVATRPIASLSYGQRRMVELCRALACQPRILLLDEPAAGLNSAEAAALTDRLLSLKSQQELAIVLIEHNMGMVMRLAERIVVLNFGCKIAEGTPVEIQNNPAVLTAYLGEGYSHAGV